MFTLYFYIRHMSLVATGTEFVCSREILSNCKNHNILRRILNLGRFDP